VEGPSPIDRVDSAWERPAVRRERLTAGSRNFGRVMAAAVSSGENGFGQRSELEGKWVAALSSKPTDPHILCGYATFLAKAGEYDRAQEVYQRSLTSDKTHLGTLCNYAVMLEARGREEEACELYKKAIDTDGGQVIALSNYGHLLCRNGANFPTFRRLKCVPPNFFPPPSSGVDPSCEAGSCTSFPCRERGMAYVGDRIPGLCPSFRARNAAEAATLAGPAASFRCCCPPHCFSHLWARQ
jgi:tetratricopeptide (TPR) repeat protein